MPNHVIRFLIWIGVVVILAAVAVFYLFYAPGREPIQSSHPGATVLLQIPDARGPHPA